MFFFRETLTALDYVVSFADSDASKTLLKTDLKTEVLQKLTETGATDCECVPKLCGTIEIAQELDDEEDMCGGVLAGLTDAFVMMNPFLNKTIFKLNISEIVAQ